MAGGGKERCQAEPGCYFGIDRSWETGDEVVLRMDMPVRMLAADPRVLDCAGQAILARGPLVYCLEQADAAFPIERARLALRPEQVEDMVDVERRAQVLGGICVLHAPGLVAPESPVSTYFEPEGAGKPTRLTLIPFHVRAPRRTDTRWTTSLPLSP